MDSTSQAVLEAASKLLVAEGPAGLSNRKIAAEAGCTTMAIYSRFGSKSGVLEALFAEGFDTLAQAQANVSVGDDPRAEIVALTRAYRDTARTYAGHYALMFGGVPGFEPTAEARRKAFGTFERLTAAAQRFIDAEAGDDDPRSLAYALFAACHGFVSVEAAGYGVPGSDAPADAVFDDMVWRTLGLTARER